MESPLAEEQEPPRGAGGRPSRLTPQLAAKLAEIIASGVTYAVAAKYVGISRATLHRWLERGRKKGSGAFRQLRRDVGRALAQAELRAVLVIQKAGAKQWQAAAWFLERRWPHRWGRTSRERAQDAIDAESPEKTAARIRDFLKAARDLDSPPPPTESNP